MSLVIIFALDLPNCMTLDPPPCICDIRKKNSSTIKAIGRSEMRSVTSRLSVGTTML